MRRGLDSRNRVLLTDIDRLVGPQALGDVEPMRIPVGDDDRSRATPAYGEQRQQPDRSGPDDHDDVRRIDRGDAHRMHGHGQRFHERPLLVPQVVRQRHEQRLGDHDPFRIGAVEMHPHSAPLEAQVRLAVEAAIARSAGQDRAQDNAVAGPGGRDARPELDDIAGCLVTHDDSDASPARGSAEPVDIGTADPRCADLDDRLAGAGMRVRPIFERHRAGSAEDEGLHRPPAGSVIAWLSAVRRRSAASSAVRSRWVSASSS